VSVKMTFGKKIAFRIYLACCFTEMGGMRYLRRRLLGFIAGRPLEGLVIDRTVRIGGIDRLELGRNVSIHWDSYISAEGGLVIGNDVAIGHRCSILTTEHNFMAADKPIKFQPIHNMPVRIDDNVWLGANVTILGGVHLRSGTVVAAGSVVTRSFDENDIILAGIPAKILRKYR